MRRTYIYKTNHETGQVEKIEVTPSGRPIFHGGVHDKSLPGPLHSESVQAWHPDAPRHDKQGRAVFLTNQEKRDFCAKNPDFLEAKDYAGIGEQTAREQRAQRQLNDAARHANVGKGNFFRYTRE